MIRTVRRAAAFGCVVAAAAACHDGVGPEPATLQVVSGAGVTDTIDVALAAPLRVELRGDGKAGAEVVFTVRTGAAPDNQPLVVVRNGGYWDTSVRDTTDAQGRASVEVRLLSRVGTATVDVNVPAAGLHQSASYTILPGAPVRLAVAPRDTPIYVGATYTTRAGLVDRANNPLPGAPVLTTTSPSLQVAGTTVQGSAVGRGRVGVRIGEFIDSAMVSVVPSGTVVMRAFGRFVGDTAGIARVNLDGSGFRWVAPLGVVPNEYSPSNADAPRWIPGTSQVVFVAQDGGASRIFIGDSTGARHRAVAGAYAVAAEVDPTVSSDGWIYYVGGMPGGSALWRVRTTGGAPEQLTAVSSAVGWPTVSPDGTRVAYVSRTEGYGDLHPYVLTLSSGIAVQISTNEAAGIRWSPAGDRLVYAVSGPWAGYSGALRVVRPDGSGDRPLIAGDYYPGADWSPDGRYVLAVRANVDAYGPELIDADAGTRLPLVYNYAWYGLSWRP